MKVLLDECAPRALKHALSSHGYECFTIQEKSWSGRANGALLDLAEIEFDVLITLDTNLRYQQNLGGRKIAILVLRARSSRLTHLSPLFPACMKALDTIKPGEIVYIGSTV